MNRDNEWLAALYEEDRSDAVTFSGAESFLSSQSRRAIAQRLTGG